MKTSSVTLYSTGYRETRTYLAAALFAAGNIVLPQLCHLVQLGGPTMLPIYFFTLVGAYKYGWRAGLLTALASPLANAALFGMPAAAVLPEILIKSVTLAVAAAMAARYLKSVSLLAMVAVAVYLFVRVGMVQGSFQRLLEEGDYTREGKRAARSPIVPIYWCLVTAAYLAWSFITMAWDRTWIVWPVAGVLFAAVVGIIRMTHKEGQKEKKAG